jgi:hypothetical protein
MTKEELIQLAVEAKLVCHWDGGCASAWVEGHDLTPYLEHFAALVAAAEREQHDTALLRQALEALDAYSWEQVEAATTALRQRLGEKDMTRDDIIRMARKADPGFETDTFHAESLVGMEAIERFAALVAAAERERAIEIAKGMQEELQAKFEQTYMEGVIAGATAEREACAKVCEELNAWNEDDPGSSAAAAIRARGKE